MKDHTQRVKPLSSYSQSHPTQLSLFQHTHAESPEFSNLILLWDAVPKFLWGTSLRTQELPLAIKRNFTFDKKSYTVEITPAILPGGRFYYPGTREEMIEAALRLLAQQGQGVFLDQHSSVVFNLRELQRELDRTGHSYSFEEIREGLLVCKKANLDLYTDGGDKMFSSSIFLEAGLVNLKDEAKTKAFVLFNSMVTNAILALRFRQINYEICMSLRSVMARQLFKRMSAVFTQASVANEYQISLETMIRDFGLTRYEEFRHNLRDALKALDELVKKDVILEYRTEKKFSTERKNKIENVIFHIRPTVKFSGEMRIGNGRQNVIQKAATTGDTRAIRMPKKGQLIQT